MLSLVHLLHVLNWGAVNDTLIMGVIIKIPSRDAYPADTILSLLLGLWTLDYVDV